MSSEFPESPMPVARAGVAAPRAAVAIVPREAVAARRAAAYAFFVVAGWAVAGAACVLTLNWYDLRDALAHPLQEAFWLLVLPGPAAALGAAAVHRRFMRAVREGRDAHAHGWAAVGVLAAHAAYGVLVFVLELAGDALVRPYAPLHQSLAAGLAQAGQGGLGAGLLSLVFGFLPNVLIAELFAGFMLRPHARRPAREHSFPVQGAGDASSAFAE
jgi:hypothetical protein